MENVLISTIHELESVMRCITKFSPKKVVFLVNENEISDEVMKNNENLNSNFGNFIEFRIEKISSDNVIYVANFVAKLIDAEKPSKSRRIVVNINNKNNSELLGVLFGAYARHEHVDLVVAGQSYELELIPVISIRKIRDTKRDILQCMSRGCKSVEELKKEIDISKGMTYNHIRELREMGFIEKDNFKITSAGQLALI